MPLTLLHDAVTALQSLKDALSCVETIVDLEIVAHVAQMQSREEFCTIKSLQGAVARPPRTFHRRLNRLRKLGIIVEIDARHDKRVKAIALSESVMQKLTSHGTVLQRTV